MIHKVLSERFDMGDGLNKTVAISKAKNGFKYKYGEVRALLIVEATSRKFAKFQAV